MKEYKKHSLKRVTGDEEFGFEDQDGVAWDSPSGWFFTGILGGCGCGSSEDFGERAVKLLYYFATPHEKREENDCVNPYDNEFYELMSHWFDSKGLIEHGGSIGGSWLTDKGEEILNIIKSFQLVDKEVT